jgi:hypothetical protein
MALKETGCAIVVWIRLAQDRDRWHACAFVNKVLNHQVRWRGAISVSEMTRMHRVS